MRQRGSEKIRGPRFAIGVVGLMLVMLPYAYYLDKKYQVRSAGNTQQCGEMGVGIAKSHWKGKGADMRVLLNTATTP